MIMTVNQKDNKEKDESISGLFLYQPTHYLTDVLLGHVLLHSYFEGEIRGIDAFHSGEACIQQFFAIADFTSYQKDWNSSGLF